MDTIQLKASADVGNSSTKVIVVEGVAKKARKQPSVVNYLPAVPRFEDEEVETLVTNLHKNIVVHITSPAITRNGLYAVGDRANNGDGYVFDIENDKKADHNITIIQPLAMVAVTAVQNAFVQNNELPTTVSIDLEYATAIPVVDYTKADAKALEERLTGSHILIVYVGEGLQVQVTINVVAAKVVQEGIPAFYAIVQANPAMFKKYNKRYNVNFTGADFATRKMLFADVGDGTTELISIVDGKPVVTKSGGIRGGVGHVSEKAVVSFKDNYNFKADITRSNFMEKVLNERDKWHNEATKELKSMTIEQEDKLFNTIVKTIEKTLSNDVDDIVLFGGGTNVFMNLEERLIEYADQYKMRVLWIDGKEASLLNAIGLDELNNKVFFKK